MVSHRINAKLGGAIMKPKSINYKSLPDFFSKENKGQVIYRADMYAVAHKKIYFPLSKIHHTTDVETVSMKTAFEPGSTLAKLLSKMKYCVLVMYQYSPFHCLFSPVHLYFITSLLAQVSDQTLIR